MIEQPRPTSAELSGLAWRKSSFSAGNGGQCVEAAPLPDGRIAVRNSEHPDAGTVYFARTEMHAFLQGAKAGEFDDLAESGFQVATPHKSHAQPA